MPGASKSAGSKHFSTQIPYWYFTFLLAVLQTLNSTLNGTETAVIF